MFCFYECSLHVEIVIIFFTMTARAGTKLLEEKIRIIAYTVVPTASHPLQLKPLASGVSATHPLPPPPFADLAERTPQRQAVTGREPFCSREFRCQCSTSTLTYHDDSSPVPDCADRSFAPNLSHISYVYSFQSVAPTPWGMGARAPSLLQMAGHGGTVGRKTANM